MIIERDRLVPVADAPRRHTIEESLAYDADPDLEDRERVVLHELARAADGTTAFQGLRRRLGLHQQALTRTLRRLERQGAVNRSPDGYSLTVQGRAAVRGQVPTIQRGEILPVLQALLPPSVTADEVADRLARRWFRDLRWHGREDKPGEVALRWLTVDTGSLVRVRFRGLTGRGDDATEGRVGIAGGMAVLEVELGRGETLDRFPAAQAILKALAELYASQAPMLNAPDDKRTFAA